MPYLTDKELVERFEYYTLQIEDHLLKGENLSAVLEQVPFSVHFNAPETLEVIHANKLHSEITCHHIDEVREMGMEYIEKHVHPATLTYGSEVLVPLYNKIETHQTFLFMQHVKKRNAEDYSPIFTFSKSSSYNDLILCLSLQPQHIENISPKMEKVVEMDSFKLKHFKRFQQLSEREVEVLILLANGKNNPKIAKELYLSRQTVETHRKNIKCKLGLQNFRDLMRYAIAFDLVRF
ncbi:MAG: helix-turn-helix transcriptional regulator [Gracilimonas sp.]